MPDIPQGEGPRYQPEFSAGERLARLEALIENVAALKTEVSSLEAKVEGHVVLNAATENSAKEEIEATRRELLTHIAAQKDAIIKAEEAQRRQFDLAREQAEKREEIANERLLALERRRLHPGFCRLYVHHPGRQQGHRPPALQRAKHTAVRDVA